jgi:hypothetical protein
MRSSSPGRILLLAVVAQLVACDSPKPPPAPPPPPPAPAAPVARAAADGGQADARPGLMERHAIWKAKKEADAKLAAELAAQEQARLIKFDRAKLPKHVALLAFTKKTRAQLDGAAAKLKGKPNAAAQLQKLVASQRKAILAQAKSLEAIDPKGGNSNITTDHDMTLQALAHDYPAAIEASFNGDDKVLTDARAELDKRQAKIESWLAQLKKSR